MEYRRALVGWLERLTGAVNDGAMLIAAEIAKLNKSVALISYQLAQPIRVIIVETDPLTEVNVMPVPTGPVAPGTSDTFTVADTASDGTAVTATNTVASSDESVATATLSDNNNGTWTAVAAGSAVITVTGTDANGSVISTGTNNPFTVDVAAPVEALASVNVA